VAPGNTAARQVVIDRAGDVSRSFNQAAAGLATASGNAQTRISDLVERINSLASDVRQINLERRWNFSSRQDAGMDARLHTTLEELAEVVDFTTLPQEDGSVTLLLAGQTPLVLGERLMPVSADFSGPQAAILSSDGRDITSQISGGRMASALEMKNTLLPAYMADLDHLAQGFADRIDGVLAQGVDSNGLPPAAGLFEYDPGAGSIAFSLHAGPLTPDGIAAASAGAPGGNANALEVAALASSKEIDGYTWAEYYGNIAARVGRDLRGAQDSQRVEEQLLAQARSLRAEISSVSLDEEAAQLIQFQRSYQAAARMVTVLNDLTEEVINLAR
jgi:flagellar hook-associated protein 1 FlgK